MRIGQRVEWAAHACALLAALPEGWSLSGAALAAFHALPPAYMAKTLQALSRAGLLRAERGLQGGYRLARPADAITLLHVEQALLGAEPRFECRNIRARGPCGGQADPRIPCEIACAFWAAERAYREVLGATTVGDITRSVAARLRTLGNGDAEAWLRSHATPARTGTAADARR
jgi:Rrf2 family protein